MRQIPPIVSEWRCGFCFVQCLYLLSCICVYEDWMRQKESASIVSFVDDSVTARCVLYCTALYCTVCCFCMIIYTPIVLSPLCPLYFIVVFLFISLFFSHLVCVCVSLISCFFLLFIFSSCLFLSFFGLWIGYGHFLLHVCSIELTVLSLSFVFATFWCFGHSLNYNVCYCSIWSMFGYRISRFGTLHRMKMSSFFSCKRGWVNHIDHRVSLPHILW